MGRGSLSRFLIIIILQQKASKEKNDGIVVYFSQTILENAPKYIFLRKCTVANKKKKCNEIRN